MSGKTRELSVEEADLIERSTKKVKTVEIAKDREESWVVTEVAQEEQPITESCRKGSYKETLMGEAKDNSNCDFDVDGDSLCSFEESESEDEEEETDCPTIRVSTEEKKRMRRKWQKAVNIKLLGKQVGFKFLEKKLYQMWEIRSPITISDLGNEFYVVRFSDGDEFENALFGGPWIVADHYLYVRQWVPNFDPDNATIDKLAVWIRLPTCLLNTMIDYSSPG